MNAKSFKSLPSNLDLVIPYIFEEQVTKNPQSIALTFMGEQLTYEQLNISANQLAHHLQDLGVKPEVMVGVYVERSLETIISILAIIKAGGAYVPLDPAYPQERLNYILQDSQVPILITQTNLILNINYLGKTILIDGHREIIGQKSKSNPYSGVTAENLLYVIYTSGSTGNPKGVMITHHNVVRLFETVKTYFNFNENDIWTLFHSYSFGFSVWEIWGALLHGGRLIIVPAPVINSPEAFYDLIYQEKVTVLSQTPTTFRLLVHVDKFRKFEPLYLRYIIFSGEAIEPYLVKSWIDKYGDNYPQLINMYALTEASGEVTYRRLIGEDLRIKSSIIGVPLPDVQIYLLNEQMQPVAKGEIGEMYISGDAVGRGYFNQAALTAEKFINNSFDNLSKSKLYKTGDLARYLANGELEFIARIDEQVKIRGFRIELAEIAAKLTENPQIQEAVVIVRGNSDHQKLVAYIVPQNSLNIQHEKLTKYDVQRGLKKILPNYMIPSAYIFLDRLPLSPNGKLDHQSLPEPDDSSIVRENEYIAPVTLLEKDLAQIWSTVLKIDKIGIQDNFFELGGNSIQGMQFSNKVQELWQSHVTITAIFQAPTIAELAVYLCKNYPQIVTKIYGSQLLSKYEKSINSHCSDDSKVSEIISGKDDQIDNILSELQKMSEEEALQFLTQQIAPQANSNAAFNPSDEYFMRLAIKEAKKAIEEDQPPYAACIVKNGEVISCVHNVIWKNQDITAHAEVQAIREACKKLNTTDLSGCVIYSTCEPCSMCLTACHWAKINKIFYGLRTEDEPRIGLSKSTVSAKLMNQIGAFNLSIREDFLRDEMFDVIDIWLKQKSNIPMYDEISEQYKKTKKSLSRKYIETYTVLNMINMIGDVAGKSVLDLGCGEGYYSRIFKQTGAKEVYGIDISARMIEIAKQEELKENLGIEYRVSNVIDLEEIKEFDIVVAVYLLHYAHTQEELLAMVEKIYRNLKPGGYLLALNENTEQNIDAYSKYEKYGIYKSISLPIQEGSKITYKMFNGSEYFDLINYYYSQEVLSLILTSVGFKSIHWQSLKVSPEGLEKHGYEYWQDFIENPPSIGFICQK